MSWNDKSWLERHAILYGNTTDQVYNQTFGENKMSGKAPKQKGNRIERECVNLAKGYGFVSKRAWGSDGRSLGWHEEVDMIIECNNMEDLNPMKFQVKGRKSIADYLKPCDEVFGQILKEDRKEALVVLRYKDLLNIFKMLTG